MHLILLLEIPIPSYTLKLSVNESTSQHIELES